MTTLNQTSQSDILDKITQVIHENYLFPDKVDHILSHLPTPDLPLTIDVFTQQITEILRQASNDQHLELTYRPTSDATDPDVLFQKMVQESRSRNFGFRRVEVLENNIGYLAVTELPPPHVAGHILQASMVFLANTQAMIIDLRDCRGGTPDMVQLLVSYFFDDEPRPLSHIQKRDSNIVQEVFTLVNVTGDKRPDVPLYILIGANTFSGAEAVAYDLQVLKRATLIGQPTRGGAHLSDFFPISHNLVLQCPIARAINPITQDNWEGQGVIPDILVAPEQTLEVACQLISQTP